jgi:hypothetical protein
MLVLVMVENKKNYKSYDGIQWRDVHVNTSTGSEFFTDT